MRLKFKIYLALGLVFLFSAGLAYADENQPALPDSQTEETEQQVDKNIQNPNDAQSQSGDATDKQNQSNASNSNNLLRLSQNASLNSNANKSNEWVYINSNIYYLGSDGNYVKGIYEINKVIYYFDPTTGALKKEAGWRTWNGKRYFNNSEGIAYRNQFISFGPRRFYMGADGSVQTGIYRTADGSLYYADNSGELVQKAQWISLNSKRYFSNADGKLYMNQFISFGPHRFYMSYDGSVSTGIFATNDGNLYHADASGEIVQKAQWINLNGKRYFSNADGKLYMNQFISFGPHRFYMGADGAAMTGTFTASDGKVYSADDTGEILGSKAQWVVRNGKRYFVSADGQLYKNQFITFGPRRFYMGPDGAVITGIVTANDGRMYNADDETGEIIQKAQWIEKNGKRYFSKDDGELYRNQFISFGYRRYYMGKDAAAMTGVFTASDGKKYAAKSDGELYRSQFINADGLSYYIDEDGAVSIGIFTASDGNKYYANEKTGAIVKKAQWIEKNGKRYFSNADGMLYRNQFISFGTHRFYMGPDGAVITGIYEANDGKLYHADATGEVVQKAQWIEINGKRYFSNSEGILYRNQFISFGSLRYFMGPDGALVIGNFIFEGKKYKTDTNGVATEIGSAEPENKVLIGYIAADVVNVRPTAGTDKPAKFQLKYNTKITILSSGTGSDGYKWYYISHADGTGFVRSDLIYNIGESVPDNTTPNIMTDEEFEQYMITQGFPDSYKSLLRAMHKAHPTWILKAAQTGLDWNYVITKESALGVNTVHLTSPDAFKSKDPNAKNADGSYKVYDSGGYIAASREAIEYYMDPRNSFDDTFFQFLSNSYDGNTQTLSGINTIVKGTFLGKAFPEGGYTSYADLLLNAGKRYGVNPFILASKLINEHGSDGNSGSVSGKVEGYEGYYNYFNIGAYAHSGRSAIENGLIYAKEHGWDSREKSIMAGTEFFAKDYIRSNKTTAYFQKFNVMNGASAVARGQYMTALWGANSTGVTLGKGYVSAYSSALTFEIPVYLSMPILPVPYPR